MKRFRFRLDSVIRYRQYREQIALMELAKARRERIHTEEKIQGMYETKREVLRDLAVSQTRGIKAGRHRIYSAYLDRLGDQIETENDRLVEIGQTISHRHEIAEGERIKKETLELLRENERKKHLEMIEATQQKEADEVVTLRYERKGLWSPFPQKQFTQVR
ncbi:MAG: flagellar export protein FliJ [Deltaproteobacteria bacterium]|nr:flagellar export protein FliJ [Deltaproteobacteria bacterium]